MSYAVIRISHQQFIVKLGDTITIDGTLGEVGKSIKMGELLLLNNKDIKIGTPVIEGDVKFKIVDHKKSAKITVSKFKAKSRYRRTRGHRQFQTILEVESLGTLKNAASKTASKPKNNTTKKPTKSPAIKTAK